MYTGFSGADLGPLKPAGVPLLGLRVRGEKYFDYHHTPADTLDKVDPKALANDTAAMALMAWLLAESPERIDAGAPK
jgi:hypothetical protein